MTISSMGKRQNCAFGVSMGEGTVGNFGIREDERKFIGVLGKIQFHTVRPVIRLDVFAPSGRVPTNGG